MQFFSTDFPLKTGTAQLDILSECVNWVTDSPHTKFAQEDLSQYVEKKDFKVSIKGESIDFEWVADTECTISSFIYSKSDRNYKWVTVVNFLILNHTDEVWVNIKAYCNSISAAAVVPPIKKPVLIIRLIDRFGGGRDGAITLSHEAFDLGQGDLDVASKLILGDCDNRLPIVYLSRSHNDYLPVIAQRLARKLCGLAHVFVEPNKQFSQALRPLVKSRNVYGGVIGVYWPNDGGVRTYRRTAEISTAKDFEDLIFLDVSELLSKRIPLRRCTREAVVETKNRIAIDELKKRGSADLNEYSELFDQDLKAKEDEIETLKSEVSRLQGVSKRLRAQTPIQGGIRLATGDEDDFFANEIIGVVLDGLLDYRTRVHEDSRRQHIIDALISQNVIERESVSIASRLKETLRGYREMTQRVRSNLQELGFEISEDSRHCRLLYQGDERYTFTLPKTGSDNRGGLNAGSDMIKSFL